MGLLLTLILLHNGFSLAKPSVDMKHQLQALMGSAKNQQELREAMMSYSNYKENSLICYFEIKEKLPPVHCYEVFSLQFKNGYFTGKEWTVKKRQLDFQCQKNTEKAQSVELLKAKLQRSNNVSAKCLKSIKDRIQDMEYQLEETIHGLMDHFSGQTANSKGFGIHN